MLETENAQDDTSWWDELINAATGKQPQVPPPATPQPPPVDQSAWEKSVEQAQVSDSLGSVHDLGLRIFQETKSFSDRPDSNEPIDLAREKAAWSILNADKRWGSNRSQMASTASPIEPSAEELNSPAVRAAYDSSMKAAREAYLGWKEGGPFLSSTNSRPVELEIQERQFARCQAEHAIGSLRQQLHKGTGTVKKRLDKHIL